MPDSFAVTIRPRRFTPPTQLALLGALFALLTWATGAFAADGEAPPTPAAADSTEHEPRAGIEVDSNSRYVWRGIVLSPGEVLQPSAWLEVGDLTLTAWGNVGLQGPDASGLDELDLNVGYERTLAGFTLESVAMAYFYPDEPEATSAELQATIGHAVGAGFQLAALVSADVVQYSGATFVSGSLSRDTAIGSGTLSLAARVGHGSPKFVTAYLSDESRSLDLVGGTVSFEFAAGGFSVRPHLDVDRPFGDSRSLVSEDPPIVLGLAIGRRF